MSEKRSFNLSLSSQNKKRKSENISYFQKTLQDSGLMLTSPPEKCKASKEIVYIEQNVYTSLKSHTDYPDNVDRFIADFKNVCKDRKVFEHYLNFNVVQINSDSSYQSSMSQSVIKILLNVPLLQSKLIQYIFDEVMNAVDQPIVESWVKIILETLLRVNSINNPAMLSTKLTDLLEVSSDKSVRLEVISAIPDLIGNQEHDSVAATLCRVLSDDQYLIPSIVDCLTYLCLSDEQFNQLQNVVLKSFTPSNSAYFSNFVKFLLTQTRSSDVAYEKTIQGLRQALAWSSLASEEKVIVTSQVLTAMTLRSYLISSKPLAKAAFTVLSNCKKDDDCKPIDIILFLVLYSTSDEKQKLVETTMKKLIKQQVLKEELLNKAFERFKPVLKEYLIDLLNLSNAFLRATSEPLIQKFASHMYMVMISELSDCRSSVVVDLLNLITTDEQLTSSTLNILNNVVAKDVNLLHQQSNQILTLLDAKDSMSKKKIKEVMDLVCALAFGIENSTIRSDVDIIISKALGSSVSSTKVQGIYAGIYAVKYLTKGNNANEAQLTEDVLDSDVSCLPDSNLRIAGKIIERIDRSTEHFPNMIVTFYEGLYEIIEQATDQNKIFLKWLSNRLTNNFTHNFIVDKHINKNSIGDIKVATKYCLNTELEEELAINIAGLTLQGNKNIEILSSCFQLVSILHYKENQEELSTIDALLGCSIVLPNEDLYSIKDINVSSTTKILDCYVHCVNWIREVLNAFSMLKDDEDQTVTPKIFQRIVHLRQIENEIEHILVEKNIPYKPPTLYNGEQIDRHARKYKKTAKKKHAVPESGKSHLASASTSHAKNSVTVVHDVVFRPLNLSLFNLLRYDLTDQDGQETELTFGTLTFLLCHLNNSLENVLVRKKNNFYNSSDAKHQAQVISKLLSKIAIDHVNVIFSVLQCVDEEDPFSTKITESCQCLEQIYNLLTIYFSWFEFKNDHQLLLKESLRIVAKVDDETIPLSNVITSAIENFQVHEKCCISLPTAISLMELLKALQEHYTGATKKRTLAETAHKFLSKRWKTPDGELEKGLGYNKSIGNLIKVYLTNIELTDFKVLVNSLVNDVKELRDKTSTLTTLESINKSNLSVLLQNLPFPLYDKIKTCMDGKLTNVEHVELWQTVATTLKEMCDIVKTAGVQHTPLAFLKTSIQILNLFLSKRFPILKVEFNGHRETILDSLKQLHEITQLLKAISSQCGRGSAKSKTLPAMIKITIDFDCKIKNLLQSNNCMDAIGRFAVAEARNFKRNGREAEQDVCQDTTIEDSDEYLGDDTSMSSDAEQFDSVGISEMI